MAVTRNPHLRLLLLKNKLLSEGGLTMCKQFIVLVALLGAVAMCSAQGGVGGPPPPGPGAPPPPHALQALPLLRAVGTAVVQVQPDQAMLTFSVRAESKDVSTARQQAAQKMAGIIKALRAIDVPGIVLSTEAFQITPMLKPLGKDVEQYAPRGEVARDIVGYSVNNTIEVELNGPPETVVPAVSQVIDAAVKHGATSVGSPRFIKVDMTKAHREALEKATVDARENVQAVARGLGVKITGYHYAGMFSEPGIEDYGGPDIVWSGEKSLGAPGGSDVATPVEARPLAIQAAIYISATFAP